jgi:hypothetical protein
MKRRLALLALTALFALAPSTTEAAVGLPRGTNEATALEWVRQLALDTSVVLPGEDLNDPTISLFLADLSTALDESGAWRTPDILVACGGNLRDVIEGGELTNKYCWVKVAMPGFENASDGELISDGDEWTEWSLQVSIDDNGDVYRVWIVAAQHETVLTSDEFGEVPQLGQD